jgi:hypothetical protein
MVMDRSMAMSQSTHCHGLSKEPQPFIYPENCVNRLLSIKSKAHVKVGTIIISEMIINVIITTIFKINAMDYRLGKHLSLSLSFWQCWGINSGSLDKYSNHLSQASVLWFTVCFSNKVSFFPSLQLWSSHFHL